MPTEKEKQVYRAGASVWAKATASTNKIELHRRFGGKYETTWFPDIVNSCSTQSSEQGKKMKYVNVTFCRGNGDDDTKAACLPLSSIQVHPPNGCDIPKDLSKFVADGGVLYR